MDNGTQIFENERYAVTVGVLEHVMENHGAKYDRGYLVTNKETGVIEVKSNSYPDAVAAAEQLDLAIENSVWKWMRIQQQTEDMERAEEIGLDPDDIH